MRVCKYVHHTKVQNKIRSFSFFFSIFFKSDNKTTYLDLDFCTSPPPISVQHSQCLHPAVPGVQEVFGNCRIGEKKEKEMHTRDLIGNWESKKPQWQWGITQRWLRMLCSPGGWRMSSLSFFIWSFLHFPPKFLLQTHLFIPAMKPLTCWFVYFCSWFAHLLMLVLSFVYFKLMFLWFYCGALWGPKWYGHV